MIEFLYGSSRTFGGFPIGIGVVDSSDKVHHTYGTIPLPYKASIVKFASTVEPFTVEELKAFHSALAMMKKTPDYVQHTSVSKLTSDWTAFEDSKKCCGNEWVAVVEPTSIFYHSNQNYGQSEVKPVVEHIEDDLKYDFRTKTHSF